MTEYRTWEEILMERFASDWEEAIGYLDVALEEYQEDGDTPFFLIGLQNVVEARGGVSKVAKKIGIAPQALSDMLSDAEAPRIDNLNTLLHALGCRLSIQSLENTDQTVESDVTKVLAPPSDDARTRLDLAPDSIG